MAGCVLATLPVFAAFLPIDLGVLPRIEPMTMVLHLAAGICATGLAISAFAARERVSFAVTHPMVFAALFVAAWTLLMAPFVEYPLLTLLGDPAFGEAAVRYLVLAVFFTSALVLSSDENRRRLLLAIVLAISFWAPVVMYSLGREFFVSLDLVGYFAVSAAVSAWLLADGQKPWRRLLQAFAAGLPALVLSSNHSIVVITLLVALPGAALAGFVVARHPGCSRSVRVLVVLAVVAAPLVGLLMKWALPEVLDVPSVLSRHLLDQVLFAAIMDRPGIAAVGQGWGTINLTFDNYMLAADAVIWDRSWDLTFRNVSHSHSIYAEALFGAGLPASIGVVALYALPVLVVKREFLPVAVFAVLSISGVGAVAAEAPSTVGAVAFALAFAVVRPSVRNAHERFRYGGPMLGAGILVSALMLISSSAWQFQYSNDIRQRIADVRVKGAASPFSCNIHPHSALYADMDLIQSLIGVYRPALADSEQGKATSPETLREIGAYLCSAEVRAVESASPSLQLGLETFRGSVALAEEDTPLAAHYASVLEGWAGKLARVLTVAPGRPDIANSFVTARIRQGMPRSVESLAQALRERNPDDPVALWYLGLAGLQLPRSYERAESMRILEKALDLGVRKTLPIPREAVVAIENALE